jgi:[ribosomal protein S18]-alanine N-acetyltransferase
MGIADQDIFLPRLELRLVRPEDKGSLFDLFRIIREQGDDEHFHPHPFNRETAVKISNYNGKDLYYVLADQGQVFGYGMLRGWDEGFEVPSLAICIKNEFRGMGYGRVFVSFLHSAAKLRKASRVRLKVYKNNIRAKKLYSELGYTFVSEENGQLVGFKEL